MALIICPECGHQVSDKADICPGCGIKVRDILQQINTQQGYQNTLSEQTQPATQQYNKAYNVQQQGNNPLPNNNNYQQANSSQLYNDNVTQDNKSQKEEANKPKKSFTPLIVSFIIAIGICSTGYYFYNSAQKQKEQEDYAYAMCSTDPLVMQMYLTRYADAPQEHRDSISYRLSMLNQLDNDWNNALMSGSKGELEKYINEHPDSPHKGEAMNKIDSIDYATATRANTVESYSKYLKQHPDGKFSGQAQDFIDGKKATEVMPEELTMAKTTCKRFFQAINSKNETKLLENVTELLTHFLNITNANGNDVVSFMNKLYKDDITNMNWHILDDFTADKVKKEDGTYNIHVKFSAEQNIERTDPNKEKLGKYVIEAEITPEGKISDFKLRKQQVQ